MFTFSCSWSFSKNQWIYLSAWDLERFARPLSLPKWPRFAIVVAWCQMLSPSKMEKKNSLGTVLTAKKQFQVACRDITTIPALGPSPSAASSHARSLHHGLPNVPGPPGNRAARLVGIHLNTKIWLFFGATKNVPKKLIYFSFCCQILTSKNGFFVCTKALNGMAIPVTWVPIKVQSRYSGCPLSRWYLEPRTKNSQDSLGNPSWFFASGNYYYWYILSIQNKHHGHSGSYLLHTVPIYILLSKITSAYPQENRRNNTQRPVGSDTW